jgi:hypothetical protein
MRLDTKTYCLTDWLTVSRKMTLTFMEVTSYEWAVAAEAREQKDTTKLEYSKQAVS